MNSNNAEVIVFVRVMRIMCLLPAMPLALRSSSRINVNQTKSNQIKPADQWLGLRLALTLPSPPGEGVC
jgi:hypothetical protein